jgi:hypothetical protein
VVPLWLIKKRGKNEGHTIIVFKSRGQNKLSVAPAVGPLWLSPTTNMYSFRCESASVISGTRWRHYRKPLFNGVILATCQVCKELRPFVFSRRRVYNREPRKQLSTEAGPQRKQDPKSFKIVSTNINIGTNSSNYLTVTAKETAIRADSQRKLKEGYESWYMSCLLCPRFEILKLIWYMGLHWMLLTVSCAIALTNWQNIFHISSFQSGGTAVASRRSKRPRPKIKVCNVKTGVLCCH